jgi:hypothetical protein
MAQTPISVSVGIPGQTNTTIYTVPAGKTAIVKGVMGTNADNGTQTFTISKEIAGQNFPIAASQSPVVVNATGGTNVRGVNLIGAPVTMAAGNQLKAFSNLASLYNLPNVSTAGTTAADGSFYSIFGNTFANGIYMAVGSCASGAYVATSPDAVTWTQQTSALPFNARLDRISCNGSVWVASNSQSSGGAVIRSANNGVTWSIGVVVAASTNIRQIINNGSTFLVATTAGRVYSSTNGTTWTESTGYNTITGSAFPEINNIGWSGTHWIIDGAFGSVASADLTTWFGYVTPNVGRSSNTFYSNAWSPAYNRYYTCRNNNNVPNILSSPNGFLWTVLSTANIVPYKINCAGTNPVLLGVTSGSSVTRFKSTDGVTFTTATDSSSWVGPVHGLENGFFLSMANAGTNDVCGLSTDPTVSAGTTGGGSTSGFILYSASADPISGKWAGVGRNSATIFVIGGTSGTNIGTINNTGISVSSAGNPNSVTWSAADGFFYLLTDAGQVFRAANYNSTWTQVSSGIGVGGNATTIKAVGTTLYVVSAENNDSIYVSSTLTGGSGWAGTNYASVNSSAFRGVAQIAKDGALYYGETLATNGTDLVWVNQIGASFAITPSNSITAMRMPVPRAIGTAQTVNGNTFLYGGANTGSYGAVYGYYTSTDVITTYGTFVNTNNIFGSPQYWSEIAETPNKVNFISGRYYVTSTNVNSYIWNGTTPTNIPSSVANLGTTIAGVVAVNPSNGWMIDGTNLASTTNSARLTNVCKTATPTNFLYSAIMTASVIEID